MERDALQQRIDTAANAADYLAIAREYLSGSVVRDVVAAEAWLMKAIEAEDPVSSSAAMGVLAREVLGREQVIPESEIPELRRRAREAQGREKAELDALLTLI